MQLSQRGARAASTSAAAAASLRLDGRLAAAGVIPAGMDARAYVEQLRASAETVAPTVGPIPAASAEESEQILRWLESPGVRLVDIVGEWTCPVAGAGREVDRFASV